MLDFSLTMPPDQNTTDSLMPVAILAFQENADIIGAKYLHAYLRANHVRSHLILVPQPGPAANEAISAFLQQHHINIIGLSIMTPDTMAAFACAARIKAFLPDALLVFGGIHATVDPDDCLQHGDAVVRGEGEISFLDIIRRASRGEDIAEAPGICCLRDGQLVTTDPAPLIHDLDSLPFPRHLPEAMYVVHHARVRSMDQGLLARYARYGGRFLNITTTRGCPFTCTYCCNSAYLLLYGRWTVRTRSAANVIEELTLEKSTFSDLLTVNIQDDCFLANSRGWLAEFAARYRAEVGLPFILRTTPAHIKHETLVLLKDAGLVLIMLGLESGSDRVTREVYRRPVTRAQFLEATRIIQDVGICALYDVILDNPYESETDLLETLDAVLAIPRPFQFQIYSLRFFKGTELQQRLVRDGIETTDPRINFFAITPTPLNLLIKMAAVYPPGIIRWLARQRNNIICRFIIRGLSALSDLLLTPLSYFLLSHKAYGSRVTTTIRLFKCLVKTFLQQRIFFKSGQLPEQDQPAIGGAGAHSTISQP